MTPTIRIRLDDPLPRATRLTTDKDGRLVILMAGGAANAPTTVSLASVKRAETS